MASMLVRQRQRHEECKREKDKGEKESGTAGKSSPTVSPRRLEDTRKTTACLHPSHAFSFCGS